MSGIGGVLLLAFLIKKENEITEGVYTYLPANDPIKAFAIYNADGESGLLINLDASSNDDPTVAEISGGKVTVGKSGEEYEFTFDLKTKINTRITGYYKGNPTVYTEKKKKSVSNQNWFSQFPDIHKTYKVLFE